MVAAWLERYMFKKRSHRHDLAVEAARHFNDASTHKSHGRRIDRSEARSKKLVIENLERSQALQDAVLTAYHLQTIAFENSQAAKVIVGSNGQMWIKNWSPAAAATP